MSDFAGHIESIMLNPKTERYEMTDGRILYWDGPNQTLVIRDPVEPHGGTIFKPGEGRKYYDNLKRYDQRNRR